MPEPTEIVINTSPLIALIAGTGDLEILKLYQRVWISQEVSQEIVSGGNSGFGVAEFVAADWLHKVSKPLSIAPIFRNSLDQGEASVIQLALNHNIQTVCIDEMTGRRMARLSGLSVTGSIGVLLRAKREGHPLSVRKAIERMTNHGIWLSERVISFALTQAGEASS